MERWNKTLSKKATNPAVDSFIEEILEVCVKHGYSISHEDDHGAFIVTAYSDDNAM